MKNKENKEKESKKTRRKGATKGNMGRTWRGGFLKMSSQKEGTIRGKNRISCLKKKEKQHSVGNQRIGQAKGMRNDNNK